MSRARNFTTNRNGNVAMMWALMGTALIGLLGLTVDFTRAVMVRTELQSAADSAVLVAARQAANVSMEDRTAAARAFFDAEAPSYAGTATVTLTDIGNNGYRLRATAPMATSISRLITNQDWTVGVNSEAVRGGLNLEVALVLDTTGSMAGARMATTSLERAQNINAAAAAGHLSASGSMSSSERSPSRLRPSSGPGATSRQRSASDGSKGKCFGCSTSFTPRRSRQRCRSINR